MYIFNDIADMMIVLTCRLISYAKVTIDKDQGLYLRRLLKRLWYVTHVKITIYEGVATKYLP